MRRKKLSVEKSFKYRCKNGTLLKCTHIRKEGLKNLYLRLKRDGTIQISTPLRVSRSQAEEFIQAKEKWIAQRVAHRSMFCRTNPSCYTKGCYIWYLGKSYPVYYKKADINRIDFEGESFLFSAKDVKTFSKILNNFYLRMAKSFIVERVDFWSKQMNLYPKEVKFRRYKSRWGCCSEDNVITFNSQLLKYDPPLIDYVIIHELAHIRHKSHKKEFWRLVERFEPNYRASREKLV